MSDDFYKELYASAQEALAIAKGEIEPSRVLVAINKADRAMSGRYWDFGSGKPQSRLLDFLDEKVHSTQARIKEATGLNITKPIYYSAEHDYQMDKLFDFITNNLPNTRRHI